MGPPAFLREEAFSFWTHAAGAAAGLVGLYLLVLRADGPLALLGYAIYGVTLIAMFVTSTLHHVAHEEEGLFRRLDMTAIYLFIAGTYTPFCLLAFPPVWGLSALALVWGLALTGIALRWLRPVTPRKVTAGLYLGLGWISVVAIAPLQKVVGWEGIALMAGGGLVYTVGAIVYARKRPDPWPRYVGYHGLWHVFVLVAAGLHFALVWRLSAP